MDFGLTGKVAMVAGASRGLGYAVARGLAAEGARVAISSREPDKVDAAAKRIASETGAEVMATAVDVRSAAAIQGWFDQVGQHFGGVDKLYVNAGGPPAGTSLSFDDEQWSAAFELLVLSAVRMVRLAVPQMKQRGGGAILFGTSTSVREGVPNLALSNVVRSSTSALSKTLANELAADNIRVNQLMPGRVATDRLTELDTIRAKATGTSIDDVKAALVKTIPLGRYGVPSEFGNAGVFLLSDAASYITGVSLQVDGGLVKNVV